MKMTHEDACVQCLGRRRWLRGLLALPLGVGLAGGPAGGYAAEGANGAAKTAHDPSVASHVTSPPQPIDALGIELMTVRLAASEFLIDLRYRVRDVSRAQPLLERKLHPVLVNEATGDRYYIPQAPKLGALRQSATSRQPAQVDKVYFMLFANPDRRLRSGDKVTLYAGDSIVKDLLVQ